MRKASLINIFKTGSNPSVHEVILIVDFGSQYTHLIAQRIRSLGVYTEIIYPEDLEHIVSTGKLDIARNIVKGIILSGGPSSVHEKNSPKISLHTLSSINVPILGICYGHQLIGYLYGGLIRRGVSGEYGKVCIKVIKDSILFRGIPRKFIVWMSHRDIVEKPPNGFYVLAVTDKCPNAAMEYSERRIYTLQFHPEVSHTEYGLSIFKNFVFEICKCKGDWKPTNVIEEFVKKYRKYANEYAVVAVSGGVDSTVTAVVLRKIFNDRLFLIFINTGLLREGEVEWVTDLYRNKLGFKNFIYIDASDKFLSALKGIKDPERKRLIIAKLYYEVLRDKIKELSRRIGRVRFLGQGTLYPDRVETGITSRHVDRIKSHHNVIIRELIKEFDFELLEPLKDLYKNEVREIAYSLGLPEDVCTRHPFPGPGLAIRILGEVNEEKLDILRKADRIVEEEVKKRGLYKKLWQAFPVLISLKTVGIKGDKRSYEYMISLRFVESIDAMTANFAKVDWSFLEHLANRILNEVEHVNRVVYDISNKPPATIEYE